MADMSPAQRERVIEAMADLERTSEVIVIDASPGVGAMVTRLVAAADLAIVLTTPEPTALTDAYALIKCVRMDEGPDQPPVSLALLVNNAADRIQAEAATTRIQAASSRFLGRVLPSLGWIAHDPHVPSAVFARQPLLLRSPGAPASKAIHRLSGTIASSLWPAGEPQVTCVGVRPAGSWLRRLIGRSGG
jgi:flagellar biosynthesis protein FlhG